MLLLYVTVSCILFGDSSAELTYEEECYGRSVRMPFSYTPPIFSGQLYFTPSKWGSRKLLMDNGQAKDPRLKISLSSVKFIDLTEREDGGTFSVSFDGTRSFDIIKLKVMDCADTVWQYYGDIYFCDVPRKTEFLEFTPLHSVDQTKVLWNRTDPQASKGGKGRMNRHNWEIRNINQADMGYYNFRAKDNVLLSRILLKVKEQTRLVNTEVNKMLFMQYPSADTQWTVNFTPVGEMTRTLMEEGSLIAEDDWRYKEVHNGIQIYSVESTDSGTFEFIDPQGNLAKTVKVVVKQGPLATFVIVAIVGGVIIGIICCCCCVKKCCCKKSSSKRERSAPETAAASAVYDQDLTQPAGPTHPAIPPPNYSYQPMNSIFSTERTDISLEPMVYIPVNIHVNPPQPVYFHTFFHSPLQVAAQGSQEADPAPVLGYECLSSGPEPQFQLKGRLFTSGHPLSSDSTGSDVYTSEKLNFL